MKYWYFKFEGEFPQGSPEHGYKGIFSSCLVPESNYQRAKAMFLQALKENDIKLIEIIEYFAVDEEELDPEDEQNTFWINLYNETKRKKGPVFDKWHVFDE
jgi:hypothetical protein